jgi:hypothetical protein
MKGKRRMDRITSRTYLDGIESRPLAEVRSMRAECLEEESTLSFERRLVHARMDILRAELDRRSGAAADASIVSRLPEILADERRASRGAFPRVEQAAMVEHPRRRVSKLISDDTLANLPALSADEISSTLRLLGEAETETSETRRVVQSVVDALSAEIARRYRSGEADPADLLVGP